jgi:hypothetical protein
VSGALAAALRAAAAGLLPGQAGTGLLIDSGAFLHREDFARYTETARGVTLMAWIDWDAAVTALDSGHLPASSGEKAVLRLAASLANGNPVSLGDTVPSLDRRNMTLLTTAICHAAGYS